MSHTYNLGMTRWCLWKEISSLYILKSLRFELVSGLRVNWSKSHMLGIALSNYVCAQMANLLGCSHQEWPSEYLGLPLGGSSRKRDFLNPVSRRCKSKLLRW